MTAKEIQAWLVRAIARSLRVDERDIDPTRPLVEFGMDSIAAVELSGDLEIWLGRTISPLVVWDYPTIDRLAAHLAATSEPSA